MPPPLASFHGRIIAAIFELSPRYFWPPSCFTAPLPVIYAVHRRNAISQNCDTVMPMTQPRHVISATVQNTPGVLSTIAGMLASRGFNIDSLAVGETEDPNLSRMTFVVLGDDSTLEQVGKQLEKIVTVVRVDDVSSRDYIERDLLLMKVTAPAGQVRSEIRELVDIFRGKVVDVGVDELTIEISGRENKVQAFIERMRPYGIVEMVRTGRIAMVRSGE